MAHDDEDKQAHRLLRLMDVEIRPPEQGALFELVRSFALLAPFENVSKLYFLQQGDLKGIPDFGQFVDGIERWHFGGTCYSNNYYLHRLLKYLGYDVRLCGADMSSPDVHIVNLVDVGGREYLIDCGYAAPFIAPLPRDSETDVEIVRGRDRYVLKPADGEGRSRMILYRNGTERHGYVVNPTPRSIGYFEPAITSSFRPESVFMNTLLLVRQYPERSLMINNLDIVEAQGAEYSVTSLRSRDELPAAIEEHFGIRAGMVELAIADLDLTGDAWN